MSREPGSEHGGRETPSGEPSRTTSRVAVLSRATSRVAVLTYVLVVLLGLLCALIWLPMWVHVVTGGSTVAAIGMLTTLIALVFSTAFMAIRDRDGQRHALLWMLAIAAENRMPLGTSAAAFAEQYRGEFRRRTDRLATLLGQGAGLSHALRAVPGLTSRETAMMAEIGEENGRLGEALRLAAARQAARATTGRELSTLAAYLGIVLFFGLGIVCFVLYFIVPKFEAIFRDFGVQLPFATIFVIQAAHFLMKYFLLLPLAGVAVAGVLLARSWLSSDGGAPWLTAWSSGRGRSAAILRALAMTAEANRPIEAGLHTLAIRYPSGRIRRRLAAAEGDALRGVDWREALRRQQLIRPSEFEALSAARAVGNLPWAMNDLADAAERRANIRRTMLAQALWPAAVGTFGTLVLLMAAAFFLPLVELIRRLA